MRVNDSYSLWQDVLTDAPQGSILGPLLFNILLADLRFTLNNTEIANYADITTLYVIFDNKDKLIACLEKSAEDMLKWFDGNLMKSNPVSSIYSLFLWKDKN